MSYRGLRDDVYVAFLAEAPMWQLRPRTTDWFPHRIGSSVQFVCCSHTVGGGGVASNNTITYNDPLAVWKPWCAP